MAKNRLSKREQRLHQELVEQLLAKCSCTGPVSDKDLEEILSMLDKLLEMEKGLEIVPLPQRTPEKMTTFVHFIRSQGVDVSRIEVSPIPPDSDTKALGRKESNSITEMTNYGVFATTNLEESQLILSIPQSLMMTADSAQSASSCSNIGFLKDDPVVKDMPNLELVMILLNELAREKSSFWSPYIDILPSWYSTPLYFSREELAQLKPSPAFQESCKLIRSIARQYAYFWSLLQAHKNPSDLPSFRRDITFDLYRWAVSTVMTRQNIIPLKGRKTTSSTPRTLEENQNQAVNGAGDEQGQQHDEIMTMRQLHALIPLWDLCNHQDGRFSTDFLLDRKVIQCYAMKSFPKGSEISIFYGNRSNEEFLIHNGFAPDINSGDYLHINLGISKNDPLAGNRSLLLHKLGLPVVGRFKLFPRSPGATKYEFPDPAILGFLRVFLMNRDELKCWTDREAGEAILVVTASHRTFSPVDEQVARFLSVRADLLLKSYPSQSELESRHPMIRRLLRSEQVILQSYIISSDLMI